MAHLKNFKSTVTRMGISNISQILSNLQIRFTKPITNNYVYVGLIHLINPEPG